jgi:hypothetical protein
VNKSKLSGVATKLKVALIALSLIFGLSALAAPASRADSLEILGGAVSWPDKMYLPDSCSSYAFQYKNNTGVRLLQLGFILTDPFGRKLENESEVGIDPNKSGTWNVQMCKSDFNNGLGPYVMKIFVKDYSSTQREISKEIYFLAIPGSTAQPVPAPTVTVTAQPLPAPTVTITAQPLPAPTVTVTAQAVPAPAVTLNPDPALLEKIRALDSALKTANAKIKKVCATKPKPKFC